MNSISRIPAPTIPIFHYRQCPPSIKARAKCPNPQWHQHLDGQTRSTLVIMTFRGWSGTWTASLCFHRRARLPRCTTGIRRWRANLTRHIGQKSLIQRVRGAAWRFCGHLKRNVPNLSLNNICTYGYFIVYSFDLEVIPCVLVSPTISQSMMNTADHGEYKMEHKSFRIFWILRQIHSLRKIIHAPWITYNFTNTQYFTLT